MNALLIGKEPALPLGYAYVAAPPYDAVVIGSLTLGQLVSFSDDRVLEALAEGKSVVLYTPGLPCVKGSRGLAASLAAKQRELKNWGVVFTDGGQRKLITAQQARQMRATGQKPAVGRGADTLGKGNFGGI